MACLLQESMEETLTNCMEWMQKLPTLMGTLSKESSIGFGIGFFEPLCVALPTEITDKYKCVTTGSRIS